ncbi:hypothetical protein MASR1M31_03790 [Porphyromonadaceae bacterium]
MPAWNWAKPPSYGPKLDFMVKDAIGRRWQLGTIQVDYNLRIASNWSISRDNQNINRYDSPCLRIDERQGCTDRDRGNFPLWLTPDQVVVLPISEKFNEYAHKVAKS